MEVKTIEIGAFQVNCYLLLDEKNKIFSLIDSPGTSPYFDQLIEKGFKLDKVLMTHGHVDHVAGLNRIVKKHNPQTAVHKDDLKMFMLAGEGQFASMLNAENPPEPSFLLEENKIIKTGDFTLKVIHTPGHTRGGVCFYDKENSQVFTGDTLFARSIGRTDLKGGDYNQLIDSIKSKLFKLPANTIVYPGHGASTSIDGEMKHNPFLN